jgi:methyl-accepting chemotaxis protein
MIFQAWKASFLHMFFIRLSDEWHQRKSILVAMMCVRDEISDMLDKVEDQDREYYAPISTTLPLSSSEQDHRLDQLSKTLYRQKEISHHVNTELEEQIVLLQGLDLNAEQSMTIMQKLAQKAQKFHRHLGWKSWGLIACLVIILLFVLIIR